MVTLTADSSIQGSGFVATFRVTDVAIPALTGLFRPNGPATGKAWLTLTGMNFGTSDATLTTKLHVTSCMTTSWTSATTLQCGQSARGLDHYWPHWPCTEGVAVTISDLISTALMMFSYDGPVVSDAMPRSGAAAGQGSLTIAGLNFGTSDLTSSIGIGHSLCSTTSWSSASSIQCGHGAGSFGRKTVAISMSCLIGTGLEMFSYESPYSHASAVFPPNGPATGKAWLTLTGMNFGTSDATLTTKLHVTSCMTTSWISATTLQCRQSARGLDSSYTYFQLAQGVTVTMDSSMIGTAQPMFSFDGPVVSDAMPRSGAAAGQGSLTLSGMFFSHYADPTPSVRVGSIVCITRAWASASSIQCMYGAGSGGGQDVAVTMGSVIGHRTGDVQLRW